MRCLVSFLKAVENGYKANPYHNALHGADVFQGVHSLLLSTGTASKLSSVTLFATLTAALAHDIGHFGKNNTYLVNAKHRLALIYNDQHILENMHCSKVGEEGRFLLLLLCRVGFPLPAFSNLAHFRSCSSRKFSSPMLMRAHTVL